ncbi:MAG: class I SAM-dependent methyltransferase [Acidobacteria bacterium]|nr:class I SAM-dependent methyltransferase [Acidobacteriota bacterium]
MNGFHRWFCRTDLWRGLLEGKILPWTLDGVELGDQVLEIGPGPGLTTEWLLGRCESLTALEIDHRLAASLKSRLPAKKISVIEGDATSLPFAERSFSSVISFTMLHHIPTAALQERLIREIFRVLEPGGLFAGSDSPASPLLRLMHLREAYLPIDPDKFRPSLESAGFTDITIERKRRVFRFLARRPHP